MLLHYLPKAKRSHVCPHSLDVFEAFYLKSAFAHDRPSGWALAVSRPDRILLFVVHDDVVNRRVFFGVDPLHFSLG
jgi:hypothetical protein